MSDSVDVQLRERLDVQARGLALWAQLGLVGYVFVAAVQQPNPWWTLLLGAVLVRDIVRLAVLWNHRGRRAAGKPLVWHLWMTLDLGVFFVAVPILAGKFAGDSLLLSLLILPWSLAVAWHTTLLRAWLCIGFALGATVLYYAQTSGYAQWTGTWAQVGLSVFGIMIIRFAFVRSTARLRARLEAVRLGHLAFDADLEKISLGVAYSAGGREMARSLTLSLPGACFMLHRDLARQGRGLRFDDVSGSDPTFRISLSDVGTLFAVAMAVTQVGYEIVLSTLFFNGRTYLLPLTVLPTPSATNAEPGLALSLELQGRVSMAADGSLLVRVDRAETVSGGAG